MPCLVHTHVDDGFGGVSCTLVYGRDPCFARQLLMPGGWSRCSMNDTFFVAHKCPPRGSFCPTWVFRCLDVVHCMCVCDVCANMSMEYGVSYAYLHLCLCPCSAPGVVLPRSSPTRGPTIAEAHAPCRAEFCSKFYLKLAGLSPQIHTCWDTAAVATAMRAVGGGGGAWANRCCRCSEGTCLLTKHPLQAWDDWSPGRLLSLRWRCVVVPLMSVGLHSHWCAMLFRVQTAVKRRHQ